MTNEAKLTLTHNDYYFETGFQAFENLQLSKTDRYQYILPYYNFNKIVSDDFFKGSLSFQSDGTNDLNYTNNLKTNIVNNLNYTGDDNITESGFVNNFNFFIKNLNSIRKNNSEYKSSPQLELMSLIEFRSEIPMTRSNDKNRIF